MGRLGEDLGSLRWRRRCVIGRFRGWLARRHPACYDHVTRVSCEGFVITVNTNRHAGLGRALAQIYVLLALSSVATAQIDLEWRVADREVRVGDTVEAGLFAVSTSGETEFLLGMDVLLSWDAASLRLVGLVPRTSAFPFSDFFDDRSLDGLNADCGATTFCSPYTRLPYNDGDARFSASILDPTYPEATPEGLRLVVFSFETLAVNPSAEIGMLATAGTHSSTRVVIRLPEGGGNEMATGALIPDVVVIADCGRQGDFDANCGVDIADYFQFEACVTGPDGPIGVGCLPADLDGDGDSDLRDAGAMQRWFTGP